MVSPNKLPDVGLDQPLDEAVDRYVALTAEGAQDADMLPAPIPEGEIQKVLFKGPKSARPCTTTNGGSPSLM